jgi:hypothetical protein
MPHIPAAKEVFSSSAVGQHPPNLLHVGTGNDLVQTKRPFALGGFFGQYMAGMGFPELEFP